MRSLIPALTLIVLMLAGCQHGPTPEQQAEKRLWVNQLLVQLGHFKQYPPEARAEKSTGMVRVGFAINARGELLRQKIVSHTGSPYFVAAVQKMLIDAAPLPAPPAWLLENGEVEVVAPFIFAPGEDPCAANPGVCLHGKKGRLLED